MVRLARIPNHIHAIRMVQAVVTIIPASVAQIDTTNEADRAVHDHEFLVVTPADGRMSVPLEAKIGVLGSEFLGLMGFSFFGVNEAEVPR